MAIVSNGVPNMDVQISVQDLAFNSFGNISRGRIAGSYGNSISIFNFFLRLGVCHFIFIFLFFFTYFY